MFKKMWTNLTISFSWFIKKSTVVYLTFTIRINKIKILMHFHNCLFLATQCNEMKLSQVGCNVCLDSKGNFVNITNVVPSLYESW